MLAKRNNLGGIVSAMPKTEKRAGQLRASSLYLQLQILADGRIRNLLSYTTEVGEYEDLGKVNGRHLQLYRKLKTAPPILFIFDQDADAGAFLLPNEVRESSTDGLNIYFIAGKKIVSPLEKKELEGVESLIINKNEIRHLGQKENASKKKTDYYLIGEDYAEKRFTKIMAEALKFMNNNASIIEKIDGQLMDDPVYWDELLTRR
jgi:hypothetical protein